MWVSSSQWLILSAIRERYWPHHENGGSHGIKTTVVSKHLDPSLLKSNNTLVKKQSPWSTVILARQSQWSKQCPHPAWAWTPCTGWPGWDIRMQVKWGTLPSVGNAGGHGNPLQYSCLENPMDRGAWRATVHGVTESDTTERCLVLLLWREWTSKGCEEGAYTRVDQSVVKELKEDSGIPTERAVWWDVSEQDK